ncbi:MAG: arginine repressor [Clostridia bacterium]
MRVARMSKEERQRAILRIIRERSVATQEELAGLLAEAGFDVAQATVSRDIRELRLVKVATEDGGYRYAEPPAGPAADALGRAQRTFREFVVDVAFSGNLLVVKTLPGSAQVVAAALDELRLEGVIGTVGGDDAILVVLADGRTEPPPGVASRVYRTFLEWRGVTP